MKTDLIERAAATQVAVGVHELARSTVAPGISAAERIARATLAADADRAARQVRPLLDPYRAGEHNRFADIVAWTRKAKPDNEAGNRLLLNRQAQLTVSRAATVFQTTADNPGVLPYTLAPTEALSRPVLPFLDALAVPMPDGEGAYLNVPQAWAPAPVGSIPVEGDTLDPISSTAEVIPTPFQMAAAYVNVSQQLIEWGLDTVPAFDALIDTAVSAALEAAMLAQLTAAAGQTIQIDADALDALDAAETAIGNAWYSGPTHVVANPDDWPTIRRVWAGAGIWPAPLIPIVTRSQASGVVLMFPASALVVEASPTDWVRKLEPGVVGTQVGGFRYGAAGVRCPDALAAITVTPAPPLTSRTSK